MHIVKLSIVTISYNNIDGLNKTIGSVTGQSFQDFEWIVIDGGSSDGSKDLIESISDKLSFWCSEPDAGIYNAINKGIKYAHGEYIQFLNSGDWFADNDVLTRVFSSSYSSDVLYGDMLQDSGQAVNMVRYPAHLYLFFFLYDSLCHQACFYKRSLFENNLYDESFRIVSDWAMNIKLIVEGKRFEHISFPIVHYDNGGISAKCNDLVVKERNLAFEKYVPIHIQEDVWRYNDNYYFTRKRKTLRLIMDFNITLCKKLDSLLGIIEKRRKHDEE